MWIERDWSRSLRALARSFPALLLTGPRQVGKTALLRREFSALRYVTLDDPARARQAETQPAAFLDAHPPPVILDEVQYAPSLLRHLKLRIDEDRRPGRYLLTGSQTFALMQGVAESLAGRCAVLEMAPLAYREARRAHQELADLDFLVRGSFPALWAGEIERSSDWYAAYVATYLERDIRNLRQVGDLRDFDRFLRAAALRSGQLLSYSDLARDVGVAPNTAKAWLSLLVTSGLVLLLEPYHVSLGKRLVKSPKLYFLDTGLVCHLVGIDDREALLSSPLAGALFETFVVGQVARHFQAARSRPPLWFWRTAQGHEVDLLVERGARFLAIECKLTEAPDEGDLKGIAALASQYGKRAVARAFVASRAPHRYTIERGSLGADAINALDLVAELPES